MLAFLFPFFTVGIEYLTGYFLIKHSMLRSENFLLEIFRDCCLLFNFQGSVLSLATAILDYHIFRCLSTTFLNYFFCLFYNFLFFRHLIKITIFVISCQYIFLIIFKYFYLPIGHRISSPDFEYKIPSTLL